MNTEKLIETFSPRLNADLDAFQRFKNPEPRDLHKKFGPTLATICNVVGVDIARASSIIDTWDPSAVTMETLHSAVRELTAPAMADMEAARARTKQVEDEIAAYEAAHPVAPDPQERHLPIAMRSRAALEARWHHTRCGAQWENRAEHHLVEDEIARRDCALAGEPYVQRDHAREDKLRDAANSTVGYAMPVR